MTVRDARDLVRYWAQFPPEHILVRGAVGFDPPEPRRMSPAEIASTFGGKVVKRGA